MIKTALKHWIYEVCIEQLFNGIIENFNTVKMEFKDGDWFTFMVHDHKTYIHVFYDLVIIKADPYGWGGKGGNITIQYSDMEEYDLGGTDDPTREIRYKGKTYTRNEIEIPHSLSISVSSIGDYRRYD